MTEYEKKDLDLIARREVRYYRKCYKYQPVPAKLKTWKLILSDSGSVTLAIILQAYDGIRQINVAI
jgi:hypothetical protein